MTIVTLDINGNQSCEALGHPSDCTEPAPGSVSQFQSETNAVTVTNSSGDSSRVATTADANISFPSHAHDYSIEQGCHESNSHKLIPNKTTSTVTINGSPAFVKENGVQTDPGTGGDVNITSEGVSSSLTES